MIDIGPADTVAASTYAVAHLITIGVLVVFLIGLGVLLYVELKTPY